MTSDELEMELLRMKIRVFVLQELLLSTIVSVSRGGGGLTLKAGQDQSKYRVERAAFEIQQKFLQSELSREFSGSQIVLGELIVREVSDLASRIGASNG